MAESPTPRSAGSAALWFGLLGGSIAWTVHLLLSYLIAEFGCETGADRHIIMGITLPAWLLMGQSIMMIAISTTATLVARRCVHRLAEVDPSAAHPAATDAYLARAGVIASGLFTLVIVVQSIPILFYLRSC